jgi:hypothetical protein
MESRWRKITMPELRRRIAFLQRNLVRSRVATAEEIAAVAARFKGQRSLAAYWEHWAELKAMAIARARPAREQRSKKVTPESLEMAVRAMSDEGKTVSLPSLGREVRIVPASFARIVRIEEHEWWMVRLEAARALLVEKAQEQGTASEEVCGECHRPKSSGTFDTLLQRITAELQHQRGMLYANVTAPGAAPVLEPVSWPDEITVAEDLLLRQTYHQVNFDVISQLPELRSEDGERDLPRSWAFLFAHQADRERRPAHELMRDRSLGSTIAVMVMEGLRDQMLRAKGKVDSDKVLEGAE